MLATDRHGTTQIFHRNINKYKSVLVRDIPWQMITATDKHRVTQTFDRKKQVRARLCQSVAKIKNTMNDVTINIHGGNNQILPNATQATQNFYGNGYIEKMAKKKNDKEGNALDPSKVKLSHYINNVEHLSYYTGKLATCDDARSLAQVVLEMRDDPEVKIDNEEMVKERFISTLLPLAPKVTTGISNIRQRINDEAERQKKFRH